MDSAIAATATAGGPIEIISNDEGGCVDGARPAAARGTAESRPDGFPKGFHAKAGGIYREVTTPDGATEPQWLISPISVLALTRDSASEGWGRLLDIVDADGRHHRWAMPAAMLAGDSTDARRTLLDLGAFISNAQGAKASLADLLARWKPKARARQTGRLGWVDENCKAFVLGDGRTLGDEAVVYQHDTGSAAAATEMRASGTASEWCANVAARCSGNPILLTAVSLALSGPLLEVLGVDGGGLHLRGGSSSGKSTAQRVAASVWGSPRFVTTWRATGNGLEGVAASCNGTILILDELGEISGREAGGTCYMLGNGAGKTRADRAGRARPPVRWRITFLSSGEISLADKVAEVGGRTKAGQEVRLLDIAADGRAHGVFDHLHGIADGAAFADVMRTATAQHYGTAGPSFVTAILDDLEGVRRASRDLINTFKATALEASGPTNGQAERAAQRMGLIAAAGEIATRYGLTGWQDGEAFGAALTVFKLWLNGRGGAGAGEAREALERTRAFLIAHGPSRFERIAAEGSAQPDGARLVVHNRAGWLDDSYYYVATDAWRTIHAGSDPKRAAQFLADAGLLDPEAIGRLTRKAPRAVAGRPRVYAIRADIIGAGDA